MQYLYSIDRKEYYTQYIHKQNKAIFSRKSDNDLAPGVPSNFIVQTKETKETFKQRVDRHLKKLIEDEDAKIPKHPHLKLDNDQDAK